LPPSETSSCWPVVRERPFRQRLILTALEVSGLDLQGTEMVVLSADDTGLGDAENGEGVYGLRRAFLVAGARNVVSSLWKVDDRVTRDLMRAFYERVRRGEGPADALRDVQLKMLKQHPYYWASFVVVGPP